MGREGDTRGNRLWFAQATPPRHQKEEAEVAKKKLGLKERYAVMTRGLDWTPSYQKMEDIYPYMAYEGINNVDSLDNLVIVLNDNTMSISKNVGALARYFKALRTSPAPRDVFVWAAGEAGVMKSVRGALREQGVPRHAFDIDGYWRTGTADLDHHAVSDD